MPKASKITHQEKDEIMQVSAKLRAENPQISAKKIGEVVGRSEKSVLKVMSDKQFSRFRDIYKKKIDKRRAEIIQEADERIQENLKRMNPYQLIGLSKTYYEQVFGTGNTVAVNASGEKVLVQVVRGNVK